MNSIQRKKIKNWILTNLGKVWYVWGGQNVQAGEADCSGLVIDLYKRLGIFPKNFPDMTAQGLWNTLDLKLLPDTGDLAFYGKDTNHITHVMIYLGEVGNWSHTVAGMCGGRRNMTKQQAMWLGSGLWVRRHFRYRRDFVNFKGWKK